MRAAQRTIGITRDGWLLIIVAVALALRIPGLAFGLPALYDQDEPIFVMAALKMLRGPTLDPGWFGHPGTTTIYALVLVDVLVFAAGRLTGQLPNTAAFQRAIYSDPTTVFLPGRVFVLLCGIMVIVLTYFLARRLFDRRVATIAALILAISPLHIKYSQIIRTDMHATVFFLLVLLASVSICKRGRWRDYAWASVWVGLACATKWPAAATWAAIAGACAYRMNFAPDQRRQQMLRLIATVPLTLATLFAASPYLLIHWQVVLANLHGEARVHHIGATGDGLLNNLMWYARVPLLGNFGWIGLALVAAGCAIAARDNRLFRFVALPPVWIILVAIALQALVWDRWIVPLLPALAIGLAVAAVWLGEWLGRAPAQREHWALACVLTIVTVPMLLTVRRDGIERTNDTRRLASNWIVAHAPRGSTIIVEQLAFDLLGHGWRFLYPVGDAGCVDVLAYLKAKIPYSTIDGWRGARAVVDLGTIDPRRIATCAADYAIVVDYDRYLAEPQYYPQEIALYRAIIANGRIAATFDPVPGKVGGRTVRVLQLGGLNKPPVFAAPNG